MNFEPIAIIGRACILPGAHSPEALWQSVTSRATNLSKATREKWRVDPQKMMAEHPTQISDRAFTDKGGFIEGFETIFDPEGFALPSEFIQKLGPLHQWLLHTGREALRDAHIAIDKTQNAGVIIGNLSYPTATLSQYAESVWLCQQSPTLLGQKRFHDLMKLRPHAMNRFMSGRPVQLLAKALNLSGLSFALDAACASSLYAIKLACDALQDHQADIMLAGGVNATDSLFLNVGFTALNALSKVGDSKPLHRDADGLIPSHGAGILVLKRLSDAIQHRDTIYGVIRGIGLSNDGNHRGFLAPAESGQLAAMQSAYEQSGINPSEVSWIECHATGTQMGDSTEIRSMSTLFQTHSPVISALKANIGHTITASSVAAVINVLSGFQAKQLPPTRAASENPMDVVKQSSFRLLSTAEHWEPIQGKRIAAVNSFGFGGNNAHLLVEAFETNKKNSSPSLKIQTHHEPIAITAVQVIKAPALKQVNENLTGGYIETISLDAKKTPFPPSALRHTLEQQLILLEAVHALLQQTTLPDLSKTAILIGMQCDAEVARRGLVWRLEELLPELEKNTADAFKKSILPLLDSATVLGAMPNITANRLNMMLDCKAPSFSVSAEEASGTVALHLALRELQQGTLHTAIVGAVDMSCEIVHHTAAKRVLSKTAHVPGDAAVVLSLKRLKDALQDNDRIIALLSEKSSPHSAKDKHYPDNQSALPLGHAHAASGLLHLAERALNGKKPETIHIYSFDELIHSFYLESYEELSHEQH